ncbi:hypothetical protein NLX83_12905 [Allokutzneria sp. A3M-2-11 16]|uniref:YciI family protein n=1 Tax=Allokutzneria sp. A3M-2-11 16 TaxID=2962043 RepID=UPI0020B69107|nr:hypothetical protein [Allokutzneria sp. A3M-2-11 16]MCP3800158.1 hypothetical protein [Allokutzneria sp. A3M-2-11 16]
MGQDVAARGGDVVDGREQISLPSPRRSDGSPGWPRTTITSSASTVRTTELAASRSSRSGPWPDDSGALLVFRADRAGVDAIMADDPYYTTPGVTVVALRRWQPMIA